MGLRRHGARRLREGGLRVSLSQRERSMLASLPAVLEPVISGEDEATAWLQARLYPAAYDDADLDAEYRALARDELERSRVAALQTFARTLEGGVSTLGTWAVDLAPDEAQAWLGVVNDARLVLAGQAGITSEEQWQGGPDPADPTSLLLWYLGWLEEQLVQAMMGSLPDR